MSNRQSSAELSNYRRMAKRAHYACGHYADFFGSGVPDVGQWMICRVCCEETTVDRIERGIPAKLKRRGDDDSRYALRQ